MGSARKFSFFFFHFSLPFFVLFQFHLFTSSFLPLFLCPVCIHLLCLFSSPSFQFFSFLQIRVKYLCQTVKIPEHQTFKTIYSHFELLSVCRLVTLCQYLDLEMWSIKLNYIMITKIKLAPHWRHTSLSLERSVIKCCVRYDCCLLREPWSKV
jgi:hypothetical protein